MILGLAVSGYGQDFLTNGLVAYYPLDGNANDASGNGLHGDPGEVYFASDYQGKTNGAALLLGNSSSRITMDYTNFNLLPEFTVSALINFEAFAGTEHPRIFSATGYELATQGISNNRSVAFNNGTLYAGAPTVVSSSSISAGRWWHIVAVRAATELRLYVNGQPSSSIGITEPPDYSRTFIPTIGGNSTDHYDNYAGLIDEVRIYNRALSASEIEQLFGYEVNPRITLLRAVNPRFDNLITGLKYQLQLSADLLAWTNQGPAFVATNTTMIYPQSWLTEDYDRLYFRLRITP